MPWRNQFKSNEEYNAWYAEYRKKNAKSWRDYRRKYNKEWRKKNGYHNEKNSKARNPEKEYARRLLQYAVKKGKIVRGNCEVCQKPKAHGHHDDYTKPLEVRWFCPLHHSQYEKKISTSLTIDS